MICTIYSHYPAYEELLNQLKSDFPKAKLEFEEDGAFKIIYFTIKGGLFKSDKKLKVSYRQRQNLSYQLTAPDCPLTNNLAGMMGFINSLPAENENVKNQLLQKISTLNCEFSFISESGSPDTYIPLIKKLALSLDAIIFAQPNTSISQSPGQHFLDKNLKLIIDGAGACQIDNLDVKIDSAYYDKPTTTTELQPDQVDRKTKNIAWLESKNIRAIKHLPCVESESETTLRSPQAVATRVLILAVTNMVAFNNIKPEQAIGFLKKYDFWEEVTSKERDFLENPTDEKKNTETWKCEGIWVLMWALNIVDELPFPNSLCSLDQIPAEQYPISPGKDPHDFIKNAKSLRSKAEILDANDLYYRYEWACVDARIKNTPMEIIHPGVVYERHYALNWLINYQNQDWDNVTCDT